MYAAEWISGTTLSMHSLRRSGFTLIELLIVLGIIAILAAIVIVAINPTKQLDDAQGSERTSNVTQLRNAINQYLIDEWELPGDQTIPDGQGNAMPICREGITDVSCINFDELTPDFIVAIPVDVDETDANLTGYEVYLDTGGRPQVQAVY